MPVEITEAEAEAYRKAVGLIQALNANPEARVDFERSVKRIYPNVRTSEDERAVILKPLEDKIEGLVNTLKERDDAAAAERKAAEDAAAMRTLEDGFSRLRDREGLQPAGEEKVREIMKERNIYDPEAAFALFERQNPKPKLEASAYTPPSWNLEEDIMPDAKAWFTNTDKAEEDTIGQVLLEMRRAGDE